MATAFPKIRPGENLLAPATYAAWVQSAIAGATVRPATGEVVLTGPDVHTRIKDGSRDLLIASLVWRDCGRAVWATKGRSITFQDCLWDLTGAEAIVTGDVDLLRLIRCRVRRAGLGRYTYGVSASKKEKRHAFYPGYGSAGLFMDECSAEDCTGMALHTNGTTDETGEFMINVVVEDFIARRCGSAWTPAIQFDCTRGAELRNVLIEGCNAGLTFSGNGQARGQGSANIAFNALTLIQPGGRFVLNLDSESKGVSFANSIFVVGGHRLYDSYIDDEAFNRYDPPRFANCVFFGARQGDYPSDRFTDCRFLPMADYEGFFGADWVPRDPGVLQGWRPVGWVAPGPPVVVEPPPPEPGDDLVKELATTRLQLREAQGRLERWEGWYGEAPVGATR